MTDEKEKEAEAAFQQRKQPWYRYIIHTHHIETVAKYCPLVAAIAAPVSTLLDIPALSVSHYDFALEIKWLRQFVFFFR